MARAPTRSAAWRASGEGMAKGLSLALSVQNLLATDPPFRPEDESRAPVAKQKRVFESFLSLVDTTSVALAVNGNAAFDIELFRLDVDELDTPPDERPFTGRLFVDGMPGFTEDAQATITQVKPGKLTLTALRKGVAL